MLLLLLLSLFSRVQLCVTTERAAHQAPPSLGFSRQEHWSGFAISFSNAWKLKVKVKLLGKLEMVKQEMTRVNVNILGISKLKWTGMGEFNSDDHYIYYCGQESLRRNGVAIMVNKKVRNAVIGCNLKNDRMISVCFQDKPFNITVIQDYAPTSNVEEAESEWFYEDLQDLIELTHTKEWIRIVYIISHTKINS